MKELVKITKNAKSIYKNKLLKKYFDYNTWSFDRDGCDYYCRLAYAPKFGFSYENDNLTIYCYANKITAKYQYSCRDRWGDPSLSSKSTDNFSDEFIIKIIKEHAPLVLVEDLEKYIGS